MNGFYFDEHMPRPVARALIEKGYSVVRAVDVGMEGKDDDADHLPYATEHQLILVTFDHPFAHRTTKRTDYFGLICLSRSMRDDIGGMVEWLAEFAELWDDDKDRGTVYWLP